MAKETKEVKEEVVETVEVTEVNSEDTPKKEGFVKNTGKFLKKHAIGISAGVVAASGAAVLGYKTGFSKGVKAGKIKVSDIAETAAEVVEDVVDETI